MPGDRNSGGMFDTLVTGAGVLGGLGSGHMDTSSTKNTAHRAQVHSSGWTGCIGVWTS